MSTGRWKWARLDLGGADPSGVTLKDPAVLCKFVLDHAPYDAAVTLADITEET